MLALLRRRRLGTATGSEASNGSDVAKQWSTWTSIEAAQLNWMRNALSSSGLGLALIHFRREIDGAPPLGGLVLVALGLGYSYSGAAVYLSAAWQLRRTLGLGAASGAALVGHALLAPGALTTAALCFADRTPAWVASAYPSRSPSPSPSPSPSASRPQPEPQPHPNQVTTRPNQVTMAAEWAMPGSKAQLVERKARECEGRLTAEGQRQWWWRR